MLKYIRVKQQISLKTVSKCITEMHNYACQKACTRTLIAALFLTLPPEIVQGTVDCEWIEYCYRGDQMTTKNGKWGCNPTNHAKQINPNTDTHAWHFLLCKTYLWWCLLPLNYRVMTRKGNEVACISANFTSWHRCW